MPDSVHTINAAITIAALIVAASVVLFLFNMISSLWKGEKAPPNPWGATTLEWQTPDTPPKHGNWGPKLPVVHRWAYDYSVPGAKEDFIPQNVPVDPKLGAGRDHGRAPLSNSAIVIALLVGIAVWFAVASRLTAKSWEDGEQAGDVGALQVLAGAHRPVGLPRRRHLAVRAVPLGLLHAHASRRRLVPPDDPEHPVDQHRGAGRREHRAAVRERGASGAASG